MADLLPSSPDTSAADGGDPRVVGLDSDDADDVLAALSSGTARELLSALHDDPGTPSELADRVDTSLQNTQYHLENLADADVIRVADTIYSEKGREMKVYAPTDQPLVVFAGDDEKETGLRAALSRLLGGIGAVAGASLLVQYLAPETATSGGATDGGTGDSGSGDEPAGGGSDDGGGVTTSDADESGDGTDSGDDTTSDGDSADGGGSDGGGSADGSGADGGTASGGEDGGAGGVDVPFLDDVPLLGDLFGAGLPPGALFFAGGATVMIAWFVLWYARAYRA
ncbi:helix-turn-helix domain-containing protein [Natronoarchaeum mannanilyticum]|uniref:HTH arsR-type domain-containing protein n=2 Tax=Natronoarchaeum mannanilyticum TaxID=926360 RepID=A0AAV3T6U4_9EURY